MGATKEQIQKAMECKTADELLALAKSWGVELTLEQAEEYIARMKAAELTEEELAQVAGGEKCSEFSCPAPGYGCHMFWCPPYDSICYEKVTCPPDCFKLDCPRVVGC